MFASQYARYLPEVGEPIRAKVRGIEEMQHQRALLFAQAEILQNEIASCEMDLEHEISTLWKKAEVKAAKKEAEQV
jgi:hypothetical protein